MGDSFRQSQKLSGGESTPTDSLRDFSYVLKNALEYYDDATIKNYDKIRKFKFYKIDQYESKIYFYDKNKDEIFTSKYELIGKFLCDTKVWVWGWSMAEATSKQIDVARRVLNYALDLEQSHYILKSELITSRHQISTNIQLDILTALTLYLSKKPFLYKLNFVGNMASIDNVFPVVKEKDATSVYYMVLLQ